MIMGPVSANPAEASLSQRKNFEKGSFGKEGSKSLLND